MPGPNHIQPLVAPNGGRMESGALYFFPTTTLRRFENCIANVLRLQRIPERRAGRFSFREAFEKIRHLMDKGMFVADLLTRHPPFAHVRVVAIGNMQRAPSAHAPLVPMIEILQAMEVVEIPKNRRVLAVNLERVKRLMSASVTCRFESGEGSVFKSREERAGVIDPDLLDFACKIMLPLPDEGLGHGIDRIDTAVEP